MPGQQADREEALMRVEHLFHQIQAENPSNVSRVMEFIMMEGDCPDESHIQTLIKQGHARVVLNLSTLSPGAHDVLSSEGGTTEPGSRLAAVIPRLRSSKLINSRTPLFRSQRINRREVRRPASRTDSRNQSDGDAQDQSRDNVFNGRPGAKARKEKTQSKYREKPEGESGQAA